MFSIASAPIRRPLPVAACLLGGLTFLAVAQAAEPADAPTTLSDVTVTGTSSELHTPYRIEADAATVDAAELLQRSPGAQVNRNGPLSGIPQYRGMYGPRIHVSVDGMPITSGGPNWMDPPLHYAPAGLLQTLAVSRGIAPVSMPGESLGGAMQARLQRPDFAGTDQARWHGMLQAGGSTVDQGEQLAAMAGLSQRDRVLFGAVSRQRGDNTQVPEGENRPSEYARDFYALGLVQRFGEHQLSLDLRRNETGDTGTSALPMDIRYVDSNLGRLGYEGRLGELPLQAWVSASEVEHEMTNFHLRPVMNPNMRRFAVTTSEGQAWGVSTVLPLARGPLSLGLDGHLAGHEADIFDPDNAMFFVRNFNEIERDHYGAFAEWAPTLGQVWQLLAGLRYHHVLSDAGEVDGTPARMMAGPAALRDRFNAADRRQRDDNLDWTLQLSRTLGPQWRAELGLARKTRAPSYQERYLWLPMESTAGLADRKRYVGTIDLASEVSHQLELGLQWDSEQGWFAPRLFWRQVDDYIQGVQATDPTVIMVSSNNGDDAPLQFANVDARLYGADIDMGLRWGEGWQAAAVLNLVRGERRDIDDNLYRVAPPNAWLSLDYQATRWSLGVDAELMANQSRVSTTNEEQATPGYGLLHLRGRWTVMAGMDLELGVQNLLDKAYAQHLGGYNRAMGNVVPVGSRLPGAGRGAYASLRYRW